ncbi:MAG: hypothetical protein LBE03_02710 [Candidatus Nomurabacteria bacterium]|jgi:hypothetical protein|nr:hypothetical protein [Candidatus Nomurabacteria bacterium]
MKIGTKGFTLIEVIAFFTVSMALIAGIFIGTGTAINRERYNDSVESFKSFLQEQYTLTANPQSARYGNQGACEEESGYMKINYSSTKEYRGRSNCLMYGRLIEFYGTATSTAGGWSSNGTVRVTPIIGKDLTSFCFITGTDKEAELDKCSGVSNEDLSYKARLSEMDDNELLREAMLGRENDGEVYNLEWDAYVDAFFLKPDGSAPDDMSQIPAQGAILIVRAPFSSTIRTFIVPYNDNKSTYPDATKKDLAYVGVGDDGMPVTKNLVDAFIPEGNTGFYQESPRYFCVTAGDTNFMSNARKVVKVTQNGGSSSAVDILSESDEISCPEYTR